MKENKKITKEERLQLGFVAILGGFLYFYLENFVRGFSHYSMILCAGISFYCIGYLSKMKRKQYSIFRLMALGALIITTFEFLTGILVNIVLDLKVWNYENQPFHILGQICLPYSLLWFFFSASSYFSTGLFRVSIISSGKTFLSHQYFPLINVLFHLSKIF